MKVREEDIKSAGLTLLYEPDWPSDPIVDILLVHGVGGHPVRSWKCDGVGRTPTSLKPTIRTPGIKRRLTKIWPSQPLRRSNSEPLLAKEQHPLNRSRTLLWKNAARSSSRVNLGPYVEPAKPGSSGGAKSFVRKASVKSPSRSNLAGVAEPIRQGARFREVDWYWPLDFLPASCPNARIFTWGYQTLVADKKPIPLQGDIFAHAGELLVELASTRAVLGARARPIVFVAHSTGGVLVKEVLRLSEAERDGPLKEILLSTAAVVFLGSPHRGTEQCNLGDAIRIMASVTMLVDPDDPALQELCGANSVEAELARQTFVRLWNSYNFRVKTFQESVIPNHRYPELRAETTIRRLASFIGDPREGAETICALHDSICKFVSAENPGYRALARTLAAFITVEEHRRHVLNVKEKECLAALVSPNPASPETHPPSIYPGTCLWLYDMPDFQAWHSRSGSNKRKILWIRGGPGCGKTVLLRSLRRRLEKQWGPAGASFIWSSDEADDVTPGTFPASREGSPVAIYRSLLAQLFPQDAHLRKALLALYNKLPSVPRTFDDTQIVSFFADYYINQRIETPARRTFIFLEVGDDACTGYVHELLSRLGQLAHNSDFSICLASSHHPEILEEENVISKPMHLRNAGDILRYVNLNLVAEWEERDRTAMHIAQKSAGVFLWAEIVVNVLNAAIIEGATQEMIEYTLDEVPGDLHGLYEWMLSTFNNRERAESLILFQWVMLAAEPMRLNDLFLAVRLTEPNPFAVYQDLGPLMAFDIGAPFSMRELRQLRNSEITSDTPYQFHRWLRARSIGLLELRADNCHQPTANEPLGLQRVHPIHSSVRTFFLSGRGFACLAVGNPSIPASLPTADFLDITHYALLRACLTYLNMRDFESLCHGAAHRRKPTANLNFDLTTTTVPVTTEWYHPPTITAPSQRHLIMSSYPFLYYAVSHLLFHLLSPRRFRYFLPQRELLAVMKANNFRLWKRWTSLLGTHDPAVIIARHALPTSSDAGVIRIGVARLLSPVYGARFRLERVLRKVARLAVGERDWRR